VAQGGGPMGVNGRLLPEHGVSLPFATLGSRGVWRISLILNYFKLNYLPCHPVKVRGPSHRVFRGRLGVYTCCGLPTCRQPDAAFFPPGLVQFVTSMTAGIATRLERPLPEQDLHVLEQLTFHGAPGPIHPSLPGHRACRVMRFGAF